MGERLSRWATNLGTAAVAAAGFLMVGCGAYEEAEYPRQYYVAPQPKSSAELAAERTAGEQAAPDHRDLLIGADDDDEYSDTDPSALTEFKPALDGHGVWVDDTTYGTVWVPASEEVGSDFQPYVSAGHWTYSDSSDYVWVSDYSWGWAPFHYGRWALLPGHGWSWIPGRRYAGAWVTWRTGPSGYGYVGWAPMGPSYYWSRGTAIGWTFGYYHPYEHYVYCPHGHMYQGGVSTYVIRGPSAREHDGRTHDYVAASPSVGGPGRVLASPSVNGDGRVIASPSVGGRTAASPTIARGPRPSDIGVRDDIVIAPPRANPGLDRAQTLAVPRRTGADGTAFVQTRPSVGSNPSASYRSPAEASLVPRPRSDTPGARALSTPHYRSDNLTMSPGLASREPAPFSGSRSSSAVRASPSVSTRSFESSPHVSSSPALRSASPSTFHSTPAYRSAPMYRSAAPSVRSSPSISSSPRPANRPLAAPSLRASPQMRSPGLSAGAGRSFAAPSVRRAGRR